MNDLSKKAEQFKDIHKKIQSSISMLKFKRSETLAKISKIELNIPTDDQQTLKFWKNNKES
jgi:hypothetical protein